MIIMDFFGVTAIFSNFPCRQGKRLILLRQRRRR